ncbi:hypothetical protein F5B19DRAFT_503417 [Rostrohypoxylon terebratum]|nr:hypothetical protein F5B19DRAFT_503417 [Rostrohypoxylon terebratum]
MSANNTTAARRVPDNNDIKKEVSPVSETTPDSSPGPSPKRHCLQGPPPYNAIDAAAAIGGLAARACEKCRSSKRKCDKKLPFCDRSGASNAEMVAAEATPELHHPPIYLTGPLPYLSLNAKCQYVHDISPSNQVHAQFVIYQSRTLAHDALFRAPEPLDGISAAQLLSLVSSGAGPGHLRVDWRTAVTNYFFCVHPWFAVIHPAVFERRAAGLVALVDNADTEETPPTSSRSNSTSTASHRESIAGLNLTPSFADALTYDSARMTTSAEWSAKNGALLILTMYLNTRMRITESGEQLIFDETYRTVKRLLSPLLLACVGDPRPSVELVQAAVLLALYEYGHGEIVAAYRTLSQAVATSRGMDIKPGQIAESGGDAVMLSVEEEMTGCLWWAMFILEQSIHQDEDAKDLPFLLESPTRDTLLPETPPMTPASDGSTFPSSPPPAAVATRQLSTGVLVSAEKFGGFKLSAKTATLFHRAIRIDKERDARPGKMPLVRAYEDLDQEIRETTLTLLNDTLDWEGALDCFAMLVSALFILYLPYLGILERSCGGGGDSGMGMDMGIGAGAGVGVVDEPLSEPLSTLHSFSSQSSTSSASLSGVLSIDPGGMMDGVAGSSHPASRSGSLGGVNTGTGAGIGIGKGTTNAAHALLQSNQEFSTALAALRFACKMSTDISCKINAEYGAAPKSPAQLCAPAGATCYLVILTFASLGRIFPEERAECLQNIAEKFESLTLFSFRWGIAG